MGEELKKIERVFKTFVEGTLIEHDASKSLSVIADDVIGIGMGNQGIVTGKEDLKRILNDGKTEEETSTTEVFYEKMQIRCYENRYGSICGVLRIKTTSNGETVESSLGQMLAVRKEAGRWLVYTVQATPLFDEIEEMEAYPIKFAESALEKYRQQEQIAKDAQKDSIAIYRVNFTRGVFEDCVVKNDMVILVDPGDQYEKAMFQSAMRYLSEEERYRFITTFSLGNIIKHYESGQTELSMEYEMILAEGRSVWLRTLIRLYMDKKDENLKGYLYVVDIDEDKRKKLELQRRAEHDPMTDLYNKKYSEVRINEKLKQVSPINQGAFLMIDLDHFKDINDKYGHQEGDRVIRETAKSMKRVIRKGDIAGRIGGDEFCIYIHGELTSGQILEKAEMICRGIREIIPSGDKETGISCSIGIVVCTSPDMTFEEIYRKADQALYIQKNSGRNGYTIYKE